MTPASDLGKPSAWERWQLTDFSEEGGIDPGVADAANEAANPAAAPDEPREFAAPPQQQELIEEEKAAASAEELERLREEAREQGRTAGFDEGRAAGFIEGRAAGFDEGRSAGLEQGEREGYAAGKERADAEIAKLKADADHLGAAAAKLELALRDLNGGVADELLALALEVARQVVRGEVSARPETVLAVVREALTHLPHQHAAIYLHPDDASLLRSYLGDPLTHAGHRIHEDAKLNRGDCLIEAGVSQIDAGAAARWRRVVEGLGLEHAWQPAKE